MSKEEEEADKNLIYYISLDLTKGHYSISRCSKYRNKSFTGNRRFKDKRSAEKFLSALVEAVKY